MDNLIIINQNGILLTDSREVAKITNKSHNDLMKSIRNYIEYLTKGGFTLSDFFIESRYKDSTGRELPCYLLTKKGCNMVANKMTGEKGVLFTATYVTKFEEMEKTIKLQLRESKAGGLNGLVKTLNGVMKEEQIPAWQRAEVIKDVMNQCGLTLPEKFVKQPSFIQITLNIPVNEAS